MADQGRLLLEPGDDLGVVVGDLADGLVCEHLGVRVRLFDGVGVVRPAGADSHVAGLFAERRPAVPAARQQPEPVDEHDRRERRACVY